jgi:hypothetical protein
MAVEQFEKSNGEGTALFVLKVRFLLELFRFWISCCYKPSYSDTENYPHVAIIGGIGGVALAVACLHRGFRLPFTNAITASKLDLRAMDSPTS